MSVELQGTPPGPFHPVGCGLLVCCGLTTPAENGCFRFSAALNRMRSFQHLCHCRVLSLPLSFPGNLKTNYIKKNNNLQVFSRLHMKSSVSLTPTFSTRIFLCIIICIASGLPFLKHWCSNSPRI